MLISHRFHNFNKNAVCVPLRFLCFKLLANSRFYSKHLKAPIFPNKTLKPYDVLNMLRFQKNPAIALQIFMSAAKRPQFKHLRASYDVLVYKLAKANKYDVIEFFLEGLKSGKSIGATLVAIIRLYGRARMPQNALKTFFQMPDFNCLSPDAVTYNTLMASFFKAGEISKVYKILSEMSRKRCVPDAATYSILIDSFRKEGKMNEALMILNEMLREGHRPNIFTYNALLRSFCDNGMVQAAEIMFSEMLRKGCKPNVASRCILIEGLCKDGQVSSAYELFRLILVKKWVPKEDTCKAMAEALYETGRFKEAVRLANEMDKWNFVPDTRTWNAFVNSWLNT